MAIARTITETQALEARVIAAARKGDPSLTWEEIAIALKLPRTTYYRRRNLPAEVRAARESSEAVYSRTEGGCV